MPRQTRNGLNPSNLQSRNPIKRINKRKRVDAITSTETKRLMNDEEDAIEIDSINGTREVISIDAKSFQSTIAKIRIIAAKAQGRKPRNENELILNIS